MQETSNSQMSGDQKGKLPDEEENINGRREVLKTYEEVHSELVVQTLAKVYAFILSWPLLEQEEENISDADLEDEIIEVPNEVEEVGEPPPEDEPE